MMQIVRGDNQTGFDISQLPTDLKDKYFFVLSMIQVAVEHKFIPNSNPFLEAVSKFLENSGSTVGEQEVQMIIQEYISRSPKSSFNKSSVEDRLYSKVEKTDSCWLWTGYINKSGYGRIGYKGKPVSAHRLSYELSNGPIPDGFLVLHKCKNLHCVNPSHIYLGTISDVVKDKVAKNGHVNQNAKKTHCKRGHELSGTNLIQGKKQRTCRTCAYESVRKYAAKKKAEKLTYDWSE